MDNQLEDAKTLVAELVQAHPQLALSDEMPTFQGCTNRILFGSFDDAPIVFKCFATTDRNHHEKKMLRLLAPSGTVPHLYPVETDRILVMERLPGEAMHGKMPALSESEKQEIFRQTGSAFAHVATSQQDDITLDIPDESSDGLGFYRTADLPSFYDYVVETGLRACAEHDIPEGALLTNALRQLERRRDEVLEFPTFFHQDDVHLNNLIVEGTDFKGFVDLEMSRQGNEVLLLAAALTMCRNTPSLWPHLRAGYEATRDAPLDRNMLTLIQDAAAFSVLIRFAWYWGSDDLPQWAIDENMRGATVRDITNIVNLTKNMIQQAAAPVQSRH